MGTPGVSPAGVSPAGVSAAQLQADAVTIGWVDGVAIPKALVEERLAELRNGPLAALLPQPGTAEGRQLVRWAAQVVLVEALCRAEAARRGGEPTGPGTPRRLDRRAAIEFGSVVTAAWERCEAVRWLAKSVAATPRPQATASRSPCLAGSPRSDAGFGPLGEPKPAPENQGFRPRPSRGRTRVEYAIRHALTTEPSAAADLTLQPMGWVTAAELPPAVADLLPAPGQPFDPDARLGPAGSSLGWHVIAVDQVREVALADDNAESNEQSDRRRAFLRWLVGAMAARVVAAPGFEHPGDPRQPDNHHQH